MKCRTFLATNHKENYQTILEETIVFSKYVAKIISITLKRPIWLKLLQVSSEWNQSVLKGLNMKLTLIRNVILVITRRGNNLNE